MSNSYYQAGYMDALKFARQMLELDENTKGTQTLDTIIETMTTNIETETK